MRISELEQNQKANHEQEVTVAGIVRATYPKPFPYFLLEDDSGTLICRPNGNLPWPGAHVEITGLFVLTIPENCSIEIAALHENIRAYVGHPTDTCSRTGCEFATQVAA